MEEIKFSLDADGEGGFYLLEDGQQMGEMVISIADKNLTVYHTEVAPEAEGKGYAKRLLDAMVDYAKEHQLQVIPLCPFVHAQFKRHPVDYAAVWAGEKS